MTTQRTLKPKKLPKNGHEATLRLIDKARFNTKVFRDQEHRVSRAGSHPDIIRFSLALQKELKRRGIPFYAFFYLRTIEQQNALYERKVTKARGGQSPHNYGMAVDLVHSKRLWDLSHKEWSQIGTIGKEVARRLNIHIVWGGDWGFYDPAHWELRDWPLFRQAKRELLVEKVHVYQDMFLNFDLLGERVKQITKRA